MKNQGKELTVNTKKLYSSLVRTSSLNETELNSFSDSVCSDLKIPKVQIKYRNSTRNYPSVVSKKDNCIYLFGDKNATGKISKRREVMKNLLIQLGRYSIQSKTGNLIRRDSDKSLNMFRQLNASLS